MVYLAPCDYFPYNRFLSKLEEKENMKNRGLYYLLAFAALMLIVGLACSSASTSTAEPTSVPATQAPAADSGSTGSNGSNANASGTSLSSSGSSALVTFTDKNNYYAIDVPGDWKHETSSGDNYYIDTFTSPDSAAVVENIAYDDGTPFNGSDNGKFALQILNQNYSKTGKEGDIHVTDDSIQKDGSERLTWSSKAGAYSGVSYFEIRNKTTFLMFTIDWGNDKKADYFDTLSSVVTSYRAP
jgi:hypothetical protein